MMKMMMAPLVALGLAFATVPAHSESTISMEELVETGAGVKLTKAMCDKAPFMSFDPATERKWNEILDTVVHDPVERLEFNEKVDDYIKEGFEGFGVGFAFDMLTDPDFPLTLDQKIEAVEMCSEFGQALYLVLTIWQTALEME